MTDHVQPSVLARKRSFEVIKALIGYVLRKGFVSKLVPDVRTPALLFGLVGGRGGRGHAADRRHRDEDASGKKASRRKAEGCCFERRHIPVGGCNCGYQNAFIVLQVCHDCHCLPHLKHSSIAPARRHLNNSRTGRGNSVRPSWIMCLPLMSLSLPFRDSKRPPALHTSVQRSSRGARGAYMANRLAYGRLLCWHGQKLGRTPKTTNDAELKTAHLKFAELLQCHDAFFLQQV